MSEIEFSAVKIDDLWAAVYRGMRDAREWNYYIHGIYEEDGQKFAIVYDDNNKLYRLDFSLTEEGMTLADEIVEVKEEFVETDNMKKFAEPENVIEYKKCAEKDPESTDEGKEAKMSEEDMLAKIAELEQVIEEKENIIMNKDNDISAKDAELAELRQFKADIEAKEQAMAVESILNSMIKFMDKETAENFRKEGLTVEFAQLDAWANKVKASVVDKVVKIENNNDGVFSFAAPIEKSKKQSDNVWERLD